MFFFLDYLSQFVTTNTENKCKNNVVQLTAEEQLKKLSQGKKYINLFSIFIFKFHCWGINLKSV